MKSSALITWMLISGMAIPCFAQENTGTQSVVELPRMVSPAIDRNDLPFSYVSQSTDQISVMHAIAGTEITPEGTLYTGYGELMFLVGADRHTIEPRIRTLEDGYLPIVHYTIHHDGIEYRFIVFAASLGAQQDGTSVANFIRVTVHNPSASPRNAFLSTAWRYQAEQSTSYATGDNRFERPVTAKRLGDYAQEGQPFDPHASYTFQKDLYLQNGKVIYSFPSEPYPALATRLREYYNFHTLAPVGLQETYTPTTPVATTEYELQLKADEERTLDFKMPIKPTPPESIEATQLQNATFSSKREEVKVFWNHLLDSGISIQTPEAKVNETYKTSLINDLMSLNKVGNQYVQTINQLHYHGFYLRDSADFVRMYDTSSYPEIARQVVDFFATRQTDDGNFLSQPGQYDGWGETLWTYGEHYRMTHDKEFAVSVYPRILRAMDWLQHAVEADPLHIMPATDVRDNEFVPGHLTGYNFIALDGLQAAQLLAHDLGHDEDALRFKKIETRLRTAFLTQLDKVSPAGSYIPPALDPGAHGTDWGNLLALTPEQQLSPTDPRIAATLKHTQATYAEGLITYHQDGQGVYLHHYLTMKNSQTELILGEQEQVIRDLYAVLLHTSSTHAGWEYSIRPWGDRNFSGNLAPHGWFAAEYRNLLRNMMVREEGTTLHFFSAISPAWVSAGSEIRVERAATYFGTVSLQLKNDSTTQATLTYSLDDSAARRPQEILFHIPWFIDPASVHATALGKDLPMSNNAILLPANAHSVHLQWKKNTPPTDTVDSYQQTVKRYKEEYAQRYLQLTGSNQQ